MHVAPVIVHVALTGCVGWNRGSSAMCTARSALSSVICMPDGTKFGDNMFVRQFMKGVHSLRPSQPRYLVTWDPQVVLD